MQLLIFNIKPFHPARFQPIHIVACSTPRHSISISILDHLDRCLTLLQNFPHSKTAWSHSLHCFGQKQYPIPMLQTIRLKLIVSSYCNERNCLKRPCRHLNLPSLRTTTRFHFLPINSELLLSDAIPTGTISSSTATTVLTNAR